VGYFELKLHKYILGTPETNITSCKKGHNRCPLRCYQERTFCNHSFHSWCWDLGKRRWWYKVGFF